MPAGRPTVMTREIEAEVCARVADGETIRQIARSEHMPNAVTIYRALAKPGEFCNHYAQAKEAQLIKWEEELVEIADDGSNDWLEREQDDGRISVAPNGEHLQRSRLRVDTRKWIMSKRAPKKYGDRVIQSGDPDAPQQHVVKHTLSDEAAATLKELTDALR